MSKSLYLFKLWWANISLKTPDTVFPQETSLDVGGGGGNEPSVSEPAVFHISPWPPLQPELKQAWSADPVWSVLHREWRPDVYIMNGLGRSIPSLLSPESVLGPPGLLGRLD